MRNRAPEQVGILKQLIPSLAERMTLRAVLEELDVGRSEVRRWRREDPAFDQACKDGQEDFTENEADRLRSLHEDLPDPKVCMVASTNLRWWLEQRNAKFKPKADSAGDSQPQLLSILQAAVSRLIEAVPVPPPAPIRLLPDPAGEDPDPSP